MSRKKQCPEFERTQQLDRLAGALLRKGGYGVDEAYRVALQQLEAQQRAAARPPDEPAGEQPGLFQLEK